jgi:PAS domain S-box-containing protein
MPLPLDPSAEGGSSPQDRMDQRRTVTQSALDAAIADPTVCTEASVLVGLDGTIGSWGRDARRMFGRSPEQVVGFPFWSLFTPDCRGDIEVLARTAQSEPRHVLATGLDTDGTRFDAEVFSTRTLGVRDGTEGVVEMVRDVTERRAVEACLVACSAGCDGGLVLAALGDALRRWIPCADLTLRVVGEDRQRRMYRDGGGALEVLDGDQAHAGNPLQHFADDHDPVVVQNTAAAAFRLDSRLAARGLGSYALMPVAVDGRVFATLNVAFRDTGMATPRRVRLLATIAEAIGPALSRALEFEEKSREIGRFERLERLDKELRALATHDMRTPLAVIAGFAGSLREKWDELPDRERLEGLDAILRNGESLTRLVEQDLERALTDDCELRCEIASFDLSAQIERVVEDFARTADARFGVRMPELPSLARADEHRSWQVLANLLSNAVKFSSRGARIEVELLERGAMAHVTVRDDGRGISTSDQRRIFDKFARATAVENGGVSGTGLGLYLSKRLVESQGGRIRVESRLGQGSAFTYTLPLALSAGDS